MDKAQKKAFVSDFNGRLQGAQSMVVAHYSGLTVSELTDFRAQMREEGGQVQVAKNRLAKIAFEGTNFKLAEDFMTGPTVLAFSADPIASAKVAQKFADSHDKFVIIGGVMGETKLDEKGVKELAKMPSLDELRAKLIGLLGAPATQVARVSAEPAAKLARVLAMKPAA